MGIHFKRLVSDLKMGFDCLLDFEKNMKTIMKTRRFLVHSHAPTVGLVDKCAYCKQFGNAFEHGIISKSSLSSSHAVFKCLK